MSDPPKERSFRLEKTDINAQRARVGIILRLPAG
jgi:hypothetical protein